MQTVTSINVLSMILNLPLFLCFLSLQHGRWVLLCNYKLLILLLISICFSWFCSLFCFHILAYSCSFRCFNFEISSTFICSFGDSYQKMSFIDNSGLWKYCLWLNNISWFWIVARIGLVWFSRMCHNRELAPLSSIPTKLLNWSSIKFCSCRLRYS